MNHRHLKPGLRLCRTLLYLYPASYRRQFGRAQIECVEDLYDRIPPRRLVRWSFWARCLGDLLLSAAGTRLDSLRPVRSARGDGMLAEFSSDLRFGLRRLLKKPTFAAVAVLTLTVGLGANTLVFSLLNSILLRPLAVPEPARLMAVWPDHWLTAHRTDRFSATHPGDRCRRCRVDDSHYDRERRTTKAQGCPCYRQLLSDHGSPGPGWPTCHRLSKSSESASRSRPEPRVLERGSGRTTRSRRRDPAAEWTGTPGDGRHAAQLSESPRRGSRLAASSTRSGVADLSRHQ